MNAFFCARTACACAALMLLAPSRAAAQDNNKDAAAHAGTVAQAQRITVQGHYDNAIGSSDAASQGTIRAELLKSRPPQRPGEVLEFVPGMIVTQHSGDGKANQYFLRGYNLDHGTDFATSVGGIPVNMPTSGHGQGYTDLNFLIPELVQRIDYRKGPYFANTGDFSAAGAADIAYRTRLDAPFAFVTLGENQYRRGLFGGSVDVATDTTLLGAFEAMRNDGPWTLPESLKRSNGVVSLAGGTSALGWSTTLMGYDAHWDSTDQIPQRLIDAGTFNGKPFGRFDAVDKTDGGETQRFSLSGEWHRSVDGQTTRVLGYAMRYKLKLFSNFTFALDRPADGDQFAQTDERDVYGLRASHAFGHTLGGLPARSEFGLQLRHDRIRVGLFDTVARSITSTTRDDDVRETLAGVYGQSGVEFTPTVRGVFGLRADQIRASVDSLSLAANSGSSRDTLVSPKLSLVFGPFAQTEFFVNAGSGFHSNDARGTTATTDPKTGEPVDKVPPLVRAKGYELGARTEAIAGLQSSLAVWWLNSDSELVYVGDAGTTEASGASRRRGIEFNNRWVPVPWFLLDADFAWTHARFANGERIP
ncbi:MAG TPA: TonB-dependent receptor, partial [Burkholderiaceae bacterium]|nr:TonB-dependent receptor [Burkholderiaceae bacterium]